MTKRHLDTDMSVSAGKYRFFVFPPYYITILANSNAFCNNFLFSQQHYNL